MSPAPNVADIPGGSIVPELAEAGQRVAWANEDGEAFAAICHWFPETGAYAVHLRRQGDHWVASWHRMIDPSLEAERFIELARRLGSFLDHARAALNYATYQLALLAIRKDPALAGNLKPEATEFPIFNKPDSFKKDNRIQKFPDEYRTAIEGVQPYDGRFPGLWLLHELSREYRHRVLHALAFLPSEDLYSVSVNGELFDPPDLEIIPRERLEHGDVVMRFTLPERFGPNPQVHPQVATTVGIEHVLCSGMIGTGVLNLITRDSGAALDAIEALFLAA